MSDDVLSAWWRRARRDLEGWQAVEAVLPAVVTYVLSALGMALTGTTIESEWEGGAPGAVGHFLFVAVYTLFFGLLPAFMFGLLWKTWRTLGGFWGWLLLGTLYGAPIWILAEQTGWLGVLGVLVHGAFAPRGMRPWIAIEYGTSSFCLMLFVGSLEGGLFPLGLIALAFQAAILLLMHLTVRHLWVDEPATAGPPVEAETGTTNSPAP